MAELIVENVDIKKKIQKLSVRQKVKNFFNLHDYKYNFIISCVEFAIAQEIHKIKITRIIKVKHKLKKAKDVRKRYKNQIRKSV